MKKVISFILVSILTLTVISIAVPAFAAEAIADGTMIYFEDFNGYTNTTTSADTAAQAGFTVLNKSEGTAITDNTALWLIEDGRLHIDNFISVSGGTDSFLLVVPDSKMSEINDTCNYTIQYDLTLMAGVNTSRYIAVPFHYSLSTYGDYDMFERFRNRYIGDSAFYRLMLAITLPLVVQQSLTILVPLIDNIMVGTLADEPFSGVSVVNQCFNVFITTLLGGISAASIFGAQFYGIGDWRGMRDTFRFRLLFGAGVTAVAIAIFLVFGDSLCKLFVDNESNSPQVVEATVGYAHEYLSVVVWSLIPFFVSQVYAAVLREAGETVHPMIASIIAIISNIFLNYLFIFGNWGLPAMGVFGAALATVIARILEAVYLVVYTHKNSARYPFVEGVYSSPRIPISLCRSITVTGTPLLINEFLWSFGMATISAAYAFRGLDVVAAFNIASTVWNIFWNIGVAIGFGNSILVGRELGAENMEQAYAVNRRVLVFSVALHMIMSAVLLAVAPAISGFYNVSAQARELAVAMIRVQALMMPVNACLQITFHTLRSGGKTIITFLFDAAYTWCVPVVLSSVLCYFTALPIIGCFFLVQISDLIKLAIALVLLKSGKWANKVIA